MTGLDHIKRALRMIGIIAENETPDAAQAENALDALNGMIAGWEHEGIRLDMSAATLAGTLPLPKSHDEGISANLAVVLAAEYGADVRPALAGTAQRSKATLQMAYVFVPTVQFERGMAQRRGTTTGSGGGLVLDVGSLA